MLRPVLGIGRLWWRTSARVLDAAAVATVELVLDSRASGEVVERVAARVLNGPELERVVEAVLASPATERIVARAIASELFDATIERLLASEQLWRLVDEVARSPAVTDAIAHQGAGFADQVAGEVRTRSRDADAWLEHVAQRALRRRAGREPGLA
jgi:hypothetical protein